ncbi:hypothetical protein D3C73_1222250 [compost metagenome]
MHELAIACQKIHRDTEQQREQHHRCAIVLGEEGRRDGNDHADEKTRRKVECAGVNIDESDRAHGVLSSQAMPWGGEQLPVRQMIHSKAMAAGELLI